MGDLSVFDIETDGLYDKVTVIHCIVINDVHKKCTYTFRGRKVIDGISLLSQYNTIVGHNIIQYDIPVIKKLYPGFSDSFNNVLDTYIMSLLFDPNRKRSHSLESYGEQFGVEKVKQEDWLYYRKNMLFRCKEDVRINTILYEYLKKKFLDTHDWYKSLALEQKVAAIHFKQEQAGVLFNRSLAERIVAKIDKEVNDMDSYLLSVIPKKIKQTYSVPVNKPFKMDGTLSKSVTDWFSCEEVCKV